MTSQPRILLLEDDDGLRELLAEVLEDEGYMVSAVNRGETAVTLAGSESFDLIIADIRMEGMGGLEALEQTQQLQPGIGSLIVSGYASELQTARAEHLEVGAFLQKPFQMQELLKFVRSELAIKSAETQSRAKESFLRQALDWALTKMAQAIDESGSSEGSLEKAADCAENMAKELGLEPELCLSARWASLFLGGQKLPGAQPPDTSEEVHSLPVLSEIVQRLSQGESTADDPAITQVVGLSLATHFDQELTSESERKRNLESRYSAPVRDVFFATCAKVSEGKALPLEIRRGLQDTQENHRSLVSLAHTLERLGDFDNAGKAYEKLTEETVSEKERIVGFLGLARLAFQAGDSAQCRNFALSVLQISKSRGPLSIAKQGLEAALLLEQGAFKEAKDALSLVGQAAKSIGFSLGLALVRSALADDSDNKLSPSHLSPLVASDSSADIGRYLHWLLPHLFKKAETKSRELYGPILIRMAQDFPPAFLSSFDASRCPANIRLRVSQALALAKYLPESVTTKLLSDTEAAIREIGNSLQARTLGKEPTVILRVQSFGNPTILVQGEPVCESHWRTKKVKYLFFILASRWGQTMSEDKLIDIFWPKAHSRNKKNLYWATSGVRSVLKRAYSDQLDPLVRFQHTLSLDSEAPRWHDLEEFQRSVKQAQLLEERGNLDSALEHYTTAAAAYTGPYLDGCYYDFAVELKRETEEQAVLANLRASEISLERNLDTLALEHATNAVEMISDREDARAAKMRALIRLGKGDEAVDEYQQISEILQNDYEVEPSLELVELYHRARLGFTKA